MGLMSWLRGSPPDHAEPERPRNFGAMAFGDAALGGEGGIQVSPSLVEFLRLGDSIASLEAIYRTQWAVRTCVNFLALNIAHLNLKTYLRTADNERISASDHPLARLLQAPNAQTTRFELVRDTVSDLAIYADAYWLKRFLGNQRRLFRIPPRYVTPRGGGIISGPSLYVIDTGAGPIEVTPDQIVHFKGYNPLDPRIGSSPLEALKPVLSEEVAASLHRTGFWRNAARRDGVIERPMDAPTWSDTNRDRFREDWQGAHSGSSNAGKTPVLEDGMHWNPDSFSPKDSEFIAGREFTLDTVATVYQIPLAMLSRKQTATFASLKEFHKVLYVDVLGPWNAMIEGAVGSQLVGDFNEPSLYVEFNIEEKLQGDFETQADALRSHVQVPDMSVNESRALRNQPRIDDPEFDTPAKPQNYTYGPASPPPVQLQVAPAALNGHTEVDAASLDDLERLLEE